MLRALLVLAAHGTAVSGLRYANTCQTDYPRKAETQHGSSGKTLDCHTNILNNHNIIKLHSIEKTLLSTLVWRAGSSLTHNHVAPGSPRPRFAVNHTIPLHRPDSLHNISDHEQREPTKQQSLITDTRARFVFAFLLAALILERPKPNMVPPARPWTATPTFSTTTTSSSSTASRRPSSAHSSGEQDPL